MNVIVGANGVGKTTLMNLILRFYNVDNGRIEYAGKNIMEYYLDDWRNQIGYVLQDNMIFDGSLNDNIILYAPNISEQQIWKALKLAGLYDTVMEWRDKLNTNLQAGERLSEGQKQRVAVARIIAKNPNIILMDEPTSNLDDITERTILSEIKEIYKEKLLIIITHREQVARHADEIFVMKDGKFIIQGRHEELINTCSYYNDLFEI